MQIRAINPFTHETHTHIHAHAPFFSQGVETCPATASLIANGPETTRPSADARMTTL